MCFKDKKLSQEVHTLFWYVKAVLHVASDRIRIRCMNEWCLNNNFKCGINYKVFQGQKIVPGGSYIILICKDCFNVASYRIRIRCTNEWCLNSNFKCGIHYKVFQAQKLSFKVQMTWKFLFSYLKVLEKSGTLPFTLFNYLFLFQSCNGLKIGKIIEKMLQRYW